MTLLIDNYDSFTYNLFQYIQQIGEECIVRRNDEVTVEEIAALRPRGLVLSPGPGRPEAAGVTLAAIDKFKSTLPILGVCLGHQAIGHAFGAKVVRAPKPVHGKLSSIRHDECGLFAGVSQDFRAARYHSLIIEETSLPGSLQITARSGDGLIMGIRHRYFAVEGVQFHPESIATEGGLAIIRNFILRNSQSASHKECAHG